MLLRYFFVLQYVKPKKIDYTPRLKNKNKGKTNIARKKIIKDAARKVYFAFD